MVFSIYPGTSHLKYKKITEAIIAYIGTFLISISREKLLSMMAGGEELDKLEVELKEMNRISS